MSISTIIPLYNKAPFVVTAVESLAGQLFPGDEVIVVDDCSTDDGALRVNELRLPNVTVIRAPSNGGPATARNLGASHARGSHLLFFDADDIPEPLLLFELHHAIDAYPEEVLFAFDLAVEARGDRAPDNDHPVPAAARTRSLTVLPRDAFANSCLTGKPLCTASSTCVRADAFRRSGGFQSGLRYCEDPELWARLSSQYRLVHVRQTLATYRDVPDSLSYGLRAQPGSVDAYVNTLLSLSQDTTDVYARLASEMVVRNAVFSVALGGSRTALRAYLARRRQLLSFRRLHALKVVACLPRTLLKMLLAARGTRKRLTRPTRRPNVF